jgi:hypothetical protein
MEDIPGGNVGKDLRIVRVVISHEVSVFDGKTV